MVGLRTRADQHQGIHFPAMNSCHIHHERPVAN
jgi:hypothetical protein